MLSEEPRYLVLDKSRYDWRRCCMKHRNGVNAILKCYNERKAEDRL
jgi:hypothetical protein